MTFALMSAVNDLDLPAEPGLSTLAIKSVLRTYCRIAQADGTFKYGLRASRVAVESDRSLSVVRRTQRYLVRHGYLEKVAVGGGRAATRWRVVLERLGIRHGSRGAVAPQPDRRDTGLDRRGMFKGMFSGGRRERDHAAVARPPGRDSEPPPSRAALAASPSGAEALAMSWAESLASLPTCEHGGRAGLMPSGAPWCPDCRRQSRWRRRRA